MSLGPILRNIQNQRLRIEIQKGKALKIQPSPKGHSQLKEFENLNLPSVMSEYWV